MSDDLLEAMGTPNSEWPEKFTTKPSPRMIGAHVQPIRESIGPGSVVSMKSGGPKLVVIERSINWAYVTWHKDDGNDVLKDWIPITCLEVAK